jgi:3-deoxy-D-manno-octulosonate 8-phosphate phosphatase (KDO 8-P phosphatase)
MKFQRELDEIVGRARKVRLLLMDCDGVMTDGRLYFDRDGEALKVFDVRDGQGISDWHRAGFESGIITGRGAEAILRLRARELGMRHLITQSRDKSAALDRILSECGFGADEVAYIGDDTGDIPVLTRVGFPVMVADGAGTVISSVIAITSRPGGRGAIREVADFLLHSRLES